MGHSNTQIGTAEVEQEKMTKIQQWTEIGQKLKESGIMKVKRDKSFWKGTVFTTGCYLVKEKASTEVFTGYNVGIRLVIVIQDRVI